MQGNIACLTRIVLNTACQAKSALCGLNLIYKQCVKQLGETQNIITAVEM